MDFLEKQLEAGKSRAANPLSSFRAGFVEKKEFFELFSFAYLIFKLFRPFHALLFRITRK